MKISSMDENGTFLRGNCGTGKAAAAIKKQVTFRKLTWTTLLKYQL